MSQNNPLQRLPKWKRIALHVVAFLIGFTISAFGLFQVLFLAKVLPHGGI